MSRRKRKSPPRTDPPHPGTDWMQLAYGGLAGLFLTLCLLKFGNPVVLDPVVDRPSSFLQWRVQSWPVSWAYVLLAVVVLAGVKFIRLSWRLPAWMPALLAGWLLLQFLSATQTVDPGLTQLTLPHFVATSGLWCLGALVLTRLANLKWFWLATTLGFVLILSEGFDQHYGGLEQTRNFIYQEGNPDKLPPEILKRLAKERIFSTLFYPNTLAGALLLLAPVLTVSLWMHTERLPQILRGIATGLMAYASAACLVWSGSKGGWLVALVIAFAGLLHLPMRSAWRYGLAFLAVVVGGTGFFVQYSDYFERGATSAAARLHYWKAATAITLDHPWLGTGPGTFAIAFAERKPPDVEMARLAHNDYLEQASDSGIPAALCYLAFIVSCLWHGHQSVRQTGDPIRLFLWLGLLGWSLHSFLEFNLYIPALSWPAFLLFGWIVNSPSQPPPSKP